MSLAALAEASRHATIGLLGGIGVPLQTAELIFFALLASTIFNMFAAYAMFGGLLERKLIARVHSRVGPLYTGPYGLLQTAADALKFLKKEIIYPQGSDRILFAAAPLLMFLTAFLSVLFVPIGSLMLIESDYSLLIVLALLSFSPIAILAGAWASNSKYSTLGGLRAAGLTMAYEVLLAVAVASIALTTHSLSIAEIVQYQHTHGVWLAFLQPFAFVLFMIAATASVERNPFDLTEAESEIVSGWKTEYGGVYFSFTLLAEYVKLLVSIFLITSLFLGGWLGISGEVGFAVKVVLLTMLFMYVRATALRFRLDQLLRTIWTRLIPAAFLNFVVTVFVLQLVGGG